MKFKFITLLLSLVFLTSCQSSPKPQYIDGVTWGMTVDELNSVHQVVDVSLEFGENMTVYRGNNQDVFGVNSEVNYIFYDGKLGAVYCHDIKAEHYTQDELFSFMKDNIVDSYGSKPDETISEPIDKEFTFQGCIWSDSIPATEICLASGMTLTDSLYTARFDELNLFFFSNEFSGENFD